MQIALTVLLTHSHLPTRDLFSTSILSLPTCTIRVSSSLTRSHHLAMVDMVFFQFDDLTEILVIIEYRNGGQSCTCSIADTAQPEGLAVSNPLNCACGLLNL